MRIGVVILPEFPWAEARARWKSLEDRGFAHGWVYDHLAWRDLADDPWYATIPTLTAAALATSTLELGTWVMSPNFRHPVTLAKELMTLDDISGGRILPGIGAGSIGWDSTVLGAAELTPRQRVDRLDEFVAMLDELLTVPETNRGGEWYQAVRARMNPAGSRSRLPLLVAGNGPRSIRIAARSDGWITGGVPDTEDTLDSWAAGLGRLIEKFRTGATALGRDPETLRTMVSADTAPMFSLSSIEAFTDIAGRISDLGFTDMVIHWPRPSRYYAGDDALLEQVAERLTDGAL